MEFLKSIFKKDKRDIRRKCECKKRETIEICYQERYIKEKCKMCGKITYTDI